MRARLLLPCVVLAIVACGPGSGSGGAGAGGPSDGGGGGETAGLGGGGDGGEGQGGRSKPPVQPCVPDEPGVIQKFANLDVSSLPLNFSKNEVVWAGYVTHIEGKPISRIERKAADCTSEDMWMPGGYIRGSALDGDSFYFSAADKGSDVWLRHVSLATEQHELLVMVPGTDGPLGGALAVDSEHVYVTAGGSLWRVPRTGEGMEQLATGVPATLSPLFLTATHIYVIGSPPETPSLGRILRVPRSGGSLEPVTPADIDVRQMQVGNDRLYWSQRDEGAPLFAQAAIYASDLEGASPVPLVTDLETVQHLALDESHVYFAPHSSASPSVARVPLGGGGVEDVVHGLKKPEQIARHGDFLYFVSGYAIYRAVVPK